MIGKIFKAIFGSADNTSKIVDGTVSGLDKLIYTDEERADFQVKRAEWFLRYLEASQPQNLARRMIAFMIVGLFCFLVLLTVAAWQWNREYSEFIYKVLADTVATPFSIIIGFYFVAHLARQLPGRTDGSGTGKD